MNTPRNVSIQFQQGDWNREMNTSQLLSSSMELQPLHPRMSAPEQTVPKFSPSNILENTVPSNEATKRYLGCSSWPRALAFVLALGVVVVAAIVVPIVLVNTVVKPASTTTSTTQSTFVTTITTSVTTTTTTDTTTTTTTSTTSTSTTTSVCGVGCAKVPISSSRLAYYTFESSTNDVMGAYPASGLSSPVYPLGYAGSAIYLDATSSERLITSPMDLSNKSFTIQFWFYLTRNPTQDNAFFGQQSLSNVGKYSLFVMSRLGRLYMGFYADDTIGATVLQGATWYHAAFVYDNDKRQRFIYLNGLLDGQSAVGVGPYLGTSGSMTIGYANIDGTLGRPSFSGYLDQLMVSTRAKTVCEILNDATLVAYFPLDGSYNDSGPNSLSLTSSGASFTTGYTNQGVSLSGSNSYVQISGLTSLGQSNYPYSIAFWVYPIVKGVLIHVSANVTGLGWCVPLITFTPTGKLITQVYDPANVIPITGPPLINNGWTHVTQTYSPTNGQKLYINGALYASASAATIYQASGSANFLTFGNMLLGTGICANPSSVVGVFQGRLDELRVYSRELSAIDACLLAQS